ncbi:hypothetical protein SNOG_15052 [Parastagonospora nodorum SN15]|uniref:Killer toxin Kp4 domain-containing protein n=1 Tax=Phaeosphaeria nodorum (strain SN15 / ATCC MYA-4574 / FGSC 10173) TaxID=321614 RepID=Q0TZP1_PHANO|nr:hypothetical protein SNOG_15052 [Parastagonospora nodorum SN15]EAT77595.1 hypothetical protein SNOG_15052 [Parastagonospora nodorum SN15]
MVFSNFILHQLALLAVIAPTTLGSSCTWARCECIDSGADAIVDTTYVDYTKCNGNVGTTSSSLSCITGGRPDGCIFNSDKFTVLGNTFNKNDYSHRRDNLADSVTCAFACA